MDLESSPQRIKDNQRPRTNDETAEESRRLRRADRGGYCQLSRGPPLHRSSSQIPIGGPINPVRDLSGVRPSSTRTGAGVHITLTQTERELISLHCCVLVTGMFVGLWGSISSLEWIVARSVLS